MAKKKTSKKSAKKSTKKASRKAVKKATKKKAGKRTTMYSSKGKKLYAVRSAGGQFKDIQSFQRAHSQDIQRDSADGN